MKLVLGVSCTMINDVEYKPNQRPGEKKIFFESLSDYFDLGLLLKVFNTNIALQLCNANLT